MPLLAFSSNAFLRPNPRAPYLRRLLLPKPLASASALTRPTPQGKPTPPGVPTRTRTPPRSSCARRPTGSRPPPTPPSAFVPPSAPHLYRHLRWLLADAADDSDPALLRAPLDDLEALVSMVKRVKGFADGWWADLGTGSGAIAVAVARELGAEGRVLATDVSEVALEVARLNVQRYGVQETGMELKLHTCVLPNSYLTREGDASSLSCPRVRQRSRI
ncbi:hypothetical protein U9M48_037435 [Paspalum notatum var. saurae]|uniref:Methyltransferase small domain-containing protein n=1 Tax=Paspalum notatum var. saurae TaxID=547442 RepID=A0AAQ3UH30_PASNO